MNGDLPPERQGYELHVGPYRDGELTVASFHGRRRSALYRFDIVVTSAWLDDTLERTALGRRAMLTCRLGHVHRDFHGIVSGIEALGLRRGESRRVAQHRLRLVPRAWLLGKRKGSRIFQDLRVDQVIGCVLREAGVACRFRLERSYPVRKYCTQYSETDLAFVLRLAAENGMFFYFEQPREFSDEPAGDVLGAAAGLASGVLGDLGRSALGGAMGALGGGGALGGVANALGDAAGHALGEGLGAALAAAPGEVLVFCDHAGAYPLLDDDAVADVSGRLGDAALDALRGVAHDAIGGAGGALGGALGSIGGPLGGVAGMAVEGATDLLDGAMERAMGGSRGPAPTLRYREAGALRAPSDDSVAAFVPRRALRPSASTYREYDPDRPDIPYAGSARATAAGIDMLSSLAGTALSTATSALGGALGGVLPGPVAGFLSNAAAAASQTLGAQLDPSDRERALGMEIHQHHPRDLFPDFRHVHAEPRRILEQHRRRREVARGDSRCARLHPGRRFTLDDHPHEHANREYVVTAAEHRGDARPAPADGVSPEIYRNTFSCVPADVPFVPRRPEHRVIQSHLTATVVGPGGDDIYVNEKGEIKVRFHWDRFGTGGDTTCWIRTMHAWGGASWGTQFIPRVGMEVVVGFDEGDPDRPLVLGSVYNATHPAAFPLPVQKTRSGIRTQSTPGGRGFNELSFEDAGDREQIYLHAARDYDSDVTRDRTAHVHRDDRTDVARDQSLRVHGAQTTRVTGDRTTELAADDHLRVEGSRHVRIAGDLDERVVGGRTARVEGVERSENVGERHAVIHGELVHEVRGAATMLVGRHDAKRSCTLVVEGVTQLTGSEVVDLASDTEIVLRCGKSSIRIAPEEIEIASPKVTVRGKDARLLLKDGEAKLKTKSLTQVVSDDKVVLKSSGASLGLGAQAKLDGAQVLLNSPEQGTDNIEATEPHPTKIELVDGQGNPLPYQRFRVVLDDGSHVTGFLDEHGKAEVDTEHSGEIFFPDLSEVESA